MALTDKEVSELKPKDKKYRVSCGSSLFIEVYPEGGKYFCWSYRYPAGRKGKQRWYQIGPYGYTAGSWTLLDARKEKAKLEILRIQGQDPRALKIKQKDIQKN